MGWLKNFLKPKKDTFVENLIKQAEFDVTGLEALVAFMKEPSEENATKVAKAEKEADEVRRILIDDLNHTFVTPFDREDIYALSRAIDDLLDYANSTVDEMMLLKISPDEHLKNMALLLLEAARELHFAMKCIQDHPYVAGDHARRAKSVENRMEDTYRKAIAEIFSESPEPSNIVQMLKRREVYRHLSNAADRADEAANLISNIVVKMT